MSELEEHVLGYASHSNQQNNAGMSTGVAVTCVTVKPLGEAWQVWFQN